MAKKAPPKTHAERIRRERNATTFEPPESDLLTPDEILDTLRREVIAISRAAEMRTRELVVLATDYARGRISPEEANERYLVYSDKWGDPTYGISSFEGRTDAQIRKEMADVRDQTSWITRDEGLQKEKDKGPSR